MTVVNKVDSSVSDASALHVGVVAARWNPSITDRLVDGAVERLVELGVGTVTMLAVPGSLELPVAARGLAETGCDAVVAVGTVVKGDTDHYDIVVRESSRGLTLVSTTYGIPVANGILAVHDVEHAVERSQPGASNKGYEAASAAVEMAQGLAALASGPASK